MKKYILFTVSALMLGSCAITSAVSSNLVEQFIKTTLQEHSIGSFSEISMKTLYKGVDYEMVAYKTRNEKGLALLSNKYYLANLHLEVLSVYRDSDIILFSPKEIQQVISIIPELKNQIKLKKVEDPNEEEYIDYTIKDNFYLSYRKDIASAKVPDKINLWIWDVKHTISANELISSFTSATSYFNEPKVQ